MKKFVALLICAVPLVLGFSIPVNATQFSWSDLEEGQALENFELVPEDLREYRPDPNYVYAGETQPNPDNPDFPIATSLELSRVYLGGQNPLLNQLSTMRTLSNTGLETTRMCIDGSDQDCFGDVVTQTVQIDAVLPVCEESVTPANATEPCLLSVSEGSISSPEVFTPMSFDGGYVNNQVTDAMKEKLADRVSDWNSVEWVDNPGWEAFGEVPTGSSPSLWSTDTDSFYARATLSLTRSPDGSVSFNGLDTELVRYVLFEEESTNFYPPAWVTRDVTFPEPFGQRIEAFPLYPTSPMVSFDDPGWEKPISCAFEELVVEEETDVSRCGIALKHISDKRYQLEVLIPESLGGWFHGRLGNANMTLDTDVNSSGLNLLTVAGEPVTVPTTSMQFTLCEDSGPNVAYQDYFYSSDPDYEAFQCEERQIPNLGLGDYGHWSPSGDDAIADFMFFRDIISDQAKGWVNMWSFGTLPQYETYDGIYGQCLENTAGLQGMISTNAMVYKAGIPDLVAGELEYQVASTPRDVNNSAVLGDYTLVMSTELARCIYDLGQQPITFSNTSITVVGDDGIPRTASTVFEDVDGWLTFKARGFGFSAPTISVAIENQNRGSVKPVSSTLAKPKPLLAPRIDKVPKTGSELLVSNGTWENSSNLTFSYQWYRCEQGFSARKNLPKKSSCKVIQGATDSSYTARKADRKFSLAARVTVTNPAGSTSVFSAAAPFGVKSLLDYKVAPTLKGAAELGSRLKASAGIWNLKKSRTSILWFRCDSVSVLSELGKPSSCVSTKVTTKSYLLKKRDVGKHLVARVTVRKGSQEFVFFTNSSGPVNRN